MIEGGKSKEYYQAECIFSAIGGSISLGLGVLFMAAVMVLIAIEFYKTAFLMSIFAIGTLTSVYGFGRDYRENREKL